jgi:hypothetical protein
MYRGVGSPAQVLDSAFQITVGVFHLLGGCLDVLGHVIFTGFSSSLRPGKKFAGVLRVMLYPMGQQHTQFFDVVHDLSPSELCAWLLIFRR